jgi:hypothetical protein
MLRRRFKQILSLEERLSEEAKRLREDAKLLPPGPERDVLIRRARQAETGLRVAAISQTTTTKMYHARLSRLCTWPRRPRDEPR